MSELVIIDGWALDVADETRPRVRDLDLALQAGLAQPRDIRRKIEAHRAELERHGELQVCVDSAHMHDARKPGRPAVAYRLTEPQALTLMMFLRTPAAADVRFQLVQVFMAYRECRVSRPQPVLATTASIGDSPVHRRDVARLSYAAAKVCGVSVHRVHGAIRRACHAPGVYQVPLALLSHVMGTLDALLKGELLLPSRKGKPVLALITGGKSQRQQELFR